MNMKDFAQYLTAISFDKALHQVRHLSYERVIASEQTFNVGQSENSRLQHAKYMKKVVAA